MKKLLMIVLAVMTMMLMACHPLPQASDFVEVKPNETAFLIALSGDGKTQAKLNSIEYLEQNKVVAKRIEIPNVDVNTCPSCSVGEYKVMPTAKPSYILSGCVLW